MKILVFYRSLEKTNAIISSTKDAYEKSKKSRNFAYFDLEFVNLDKRNYAKYLNILEMDKSLPNVIYIWFDEEKITEYINETYPDIKVIHFDTKCIKREECYFGGTYKSYALLDMITDNFKKDLETKSYIIVDTYKETINSYSFDEISLAEYLYKNKFAKVVNSVDEGMNVLIKSFEYEIINYEKQNIRCKEEIKNNNKCIKERQKKIEKIKKMKGE